MDEWLDISTAPRDGTIIAVGWADDGEMQEWFNMQWGHIQKNGLFPGQVGMWVSPCGSFTWQEEDHGPTHWRPLRVRKDEYTCLTLPNHIL